MPRVRDESVAEHSFFVAAIVMRLHGDYTFDLGVALQCAISHDVAEVFIDDINHEIKRDFPDVANALKAAERTVMNNFPNPFQQGAFIYNSSTTEGTIVHLADVIQCLQYAKTEISLGNQGYMLKVEEESTRRIKELEEKLRHVRRQENS